MRRLNILITDLVKQKGNLITIPKLTKPTFDKLRKREHLSEDSRLFNDNTTGEIIDVLESTDINTLVYINLKEVVCGKEHRVGCIHDSGSIRLINKHRTAYQQGEYKFTLELVSSCDDSSTFKVEPVNFKRAIFDVKHSVYAPALGRMVAATSKVTKAELLVHTLKADGTYDFNTVPKDLNVPALIKQYGVIACSPPKEEEKEESEPTTFFSLGDYYDDRVMEVLNVIEDISTVELHHAGGGEHVVNSYLIWFVNPLHTTLGCTDATLIVGEDNTVVSLHVGNNKEYGKALNDAVKHAESLMKTNVQDFMALDENYKKLDKDVLYAKRWFYTYKKPHDRFVSNVYDEARILAISAIKDQFGVDKLFCDYNGEQWMVNGYSRLGDFYLTKSIDGSCPSYDTIIVDGERKAMRVMIEDVSNWSSEIDKEKFYPKK